MDLSAACAQGDRGAARAVLMVQRGRGGRMEGASPGMLARMQGGERPFGEHSAPKHARCFFIYKYNCTC